VRIFLLRHTWFHAASVYATLALELGFCQGLNAIMALQGGMGAVTSRQLYDLVVGAMAMFQQRELHR
jgi:hypothetical protein